MSAMDRLSFIDMPVKRYGWSRQSVHLDGRLIGYLDRHAQTYRAEWLICDPRWNTVGERTYNDRDVALDALVEASDPPRAPATRSDVPDGA